MSDTTAKPSAKASPVSMTKQTKGAGAARPTSDTVTPPRTIDLAAGALLVMVVGGLLRALLLLGNTPMLTAFVIKSNHDSKSPDKNFTVTEQANAVHQLRSGALITGVVVGIALVLLAWAMRRTRSASASRWALLVVFLFGGPLPFYVIPTSGLPGAVVAVSMLIGIASIAVLLLIFVPPASQQYFKACRLANVPEDQRGQPRPGLGSLFGPRRPAGAAGGGRFGAASRPAASSPASAASDRPTTPKAKAKVRSDSDAVAKGAELARSRAKASKSRRTAD